MVERFNRRIAEAIGREPKRGIAHRLFASHDDRNAFLNQFVHDYNHTRLKCLGYLAPKQALDNLAGPNTKAGTSFTGKPDSTFPDRAIGEDPGVPFAELLFAARVVERPVIIMAAD